MQRLSDVYTDIVVEDLGLKALLLAWAFVLRSGAGHARQAQRGFGDGSHAGAQGAGGLGVRHPSFLLGKDGPVLQAQSAAAEVAHRTVSAHSWGGKISSDDPCAGLSGPALDKCYGIQDATTPDAKKIAKPIQDAVTNSLVVKPFMLLQYGRILDPGRPPTARPMPRT
ncbi:hypothetical protein [Streptomyces sp. KL116D]|uniref:hypothetical protein n=1 Tax=Streptomyces sp. KL116D TaxID=3045152 RepID=UPI0035585997